MRAAGVAALAAFPMALTACGASAAKTAGSSAPAPSASATPSRRGLTSVATLPPVAVSDSGGSTFEVSATPVEQSLAVSVNTYLWSAAPGQTFLIDTLTVKNPTAGVETLSDFDDLTSGLAPDVVFVVSASNAAALGYAADCGIDPALPPSLCAISFGQGLTVDLDTADHDNRSAVTLAPGSTAQITLSYGPVLDSVAPSMVTMYFDDGVAPPSDLTP